MVPLPLVAYLFWIVSLPAFWSLPIISFFLPFVSILFFKNLVGFHHLNTIIHKVMKFH